MYKIKGQDQKEYGPVDAAQVRLWISQGRVDGQTPGQLEGTAGWRPLSSFPEFATVIAPPPLVRPVITPEPDNAITTIIPYRNAPALIAYFLGVFSLIPCFGLALGAAAFIFGIIGLKRAQQRPESKGKVHAWIGIILGGIIVLLHIAALVIIIVVRSKEH